MATIEHPIVIGIFRDHSLANQAIDELRHAGFRDDEIRVVGQEAPAKGLLGCLVDRLVGQEVANGHLSDELVSKGIPQEEAIYYQDQLETGCTVVLVESYGHQLEARDILHHHGAYDASNRSSQAEDGRVIPVSEEELQVHKQQVVAGEVVVRKEIVTEEKVITVPITREELVIERHPGQALSSSQTVNTDDRFDEVLRDGGTIRIVLREEQIRIEKYPVVKEELLIRKRKISENRHVLENLKREEAHIEYAGNVNIHNNEVDDVSSETEPEI